VAIVKTKPQVASNLQPAERVDVKAILAKASEFQRAVFDAVKTRKSNLEVVAVAGSGKSTTLKWLAQLISSWFPGTTILVVTFSKRSADDLVSKMGGLAGVTVCTLNSLGWRYCRAAYGRVELDANKTENTLRYYGGFESGPDGRMTKEEYRRFRSMSGPLCRLVDLVRGLYDGSTPIDPTDVAKMTDIANRYGVELEDVDEKFWQTFAVVYERVISNTNVMDFTDQMFQVVHGKLPVSGFDFVFFDEAQDTNPVQMKMADMIRVNRKGTILAYVGDPRQSIYGFRGADPEAMNKMRGMYKAKTLPLSVCYRCCKAVVRRAQKIEPTIQWAPGAVEGIERVTSEDKFVTEAGPGDFVLCRTNAPLVDHCFRMIRAGRKAVVLGRDIGKSLVAFVDMVQSKHPGMPLHEAVDAYSFTQADKMSRMGREVEAQNLRDKCDTIHALIQDPADGVQQIKMRIDAIFSDEKTPGVTFGTVHKMKGMEAKRVFILRPDLMPHCMAKTPEQAVQESNLVYVAITRAMEELVWIGGIPQIAGGDLKPAEPKDNFRVVGNYASAEGVKVVERPAPKPTPTKQDFNNALRAVLGGASAEQAIAGIPGLQPLPPKKVGLTNETIEDVWANRVKPAPAAPAGTPAKRVFGKATYPDRGQYWAAFVARQKKQGR
jgi:DNA helicase-2/ATP-dependent DNA helicase PcrA